MAVLVGNLITETAGLNKRIHLPDGSAILRLAGTARVGKTPTLSTIVKQRVNVKGQDDLDMIVPDNSFVIRCDWKVPSLAVGSQVPNTINDGLRGTAGDKLKVATAGQGVTSTVASSLGGVSAAFDSNGIFSAFGVSYGKRINPFANDAAAIAGLGTYSGGTEADRTVVLFSVNATDIAAGSGYYAAGVGAGFGYPSTFIDIPVFVTVWIPNDCPSILDYGNVENSSVLN